MNEKKSLGDDAMAQLADLAEEQLRRSEIVEAKEKELKAAKASLRDISETAIPELMETLKLQKFTTLNGLQINVKEAVRASIKKGSETEAYQWLRDNGAESLIKRTVSVQFGRGEDAEAQKAVQKLSGLPVEDVSKVHPQTLAKFVRETLDDGDPIEMELLGVHIQRVSTVKTDN